MQEFDILVIGGGPAGYQAAMEASKYEANVCLIERDLLGGTCLNRGCIPTKVLREFAQVFYTIKKADIFGVNIDNFSIDFSKYRERKERVIQRLRKGIESILKKYRVEVIKGEGFLKTPNIVSVTSMGRSVDLKAKNIIIATGSRTRNSLFDESCTNIISSDEVLNLLSLPKKVLIIGGGVVGCEFTSIFVELGSEVILVEK